MSVQGDQLATYRLSIATISRSGTRAGPRICHGPVIPGISSSRRRCQPSMRVLLDHERPGPDEAHLAADDVQQLRQLVQRGAPQQAADRVTRGSSAILKSPPASLRWRSSSFISSASGTIVRNLSMRTPARPPDAQLAEEHRAAAVELDRDRDHRAPARATAISAAPARSVARFTHRSPARQPEAPDVEPRRRADDVGGERRAGELE